MMIGRSQGMDNIKVLDKTLFIGNQKYNVKNLPDYLQANSEWLYGNCKCKTVSFFPFLLYIV